MVTLAKRLKQLRAQRKLTQLQLAKKAGLTLAYIGRLETGHYDPQLSTLKRLAKALKVFLAELTDQRRERGKNMLSPEQIVAQTEAVTSDTPNSKIEELIFQIGRMRRLGIPVPETDYDYNNNWDWVQFNIHRNLKREVKELREGANA